MHDSFEISLARPDRLLAKAVWRTNETVSITEYDEKPLHWRIVPSRKLSSSMRYYCTTLQVSVAKEAYVALSFYTSTARGYMYHVVTAGSRKVPPFGKEFQ